MFHKSLISDYGGFRKYLGNFIDEVFSWNKQIGVLCTNISRANGTLSKLRHFAPLKTCLLVCYSIFYLHSWHGCLAWSYTKEINIHEINKLQKRCIRILTFSVFNLHFFAKLKLLKVPDLFTLEKLILCLIIFKFAFLMNLRGFLLSIMVYTHI